MSFPLVRRNHKLRKNLDRRSLVNKKQASVTCEIVLTLETVTGFYTAARMNFKIRYSAGSNAFQLTEILNPYKINIVMYNTVLFFLILHRKIRT